jgi:hypothetical protein
MWDVLNELKIGVSIGNLVDRTIIGFIRGEQFLDDCVAMIWSRIN